MAAKNFTSLSFLDSHIGYCKDCKVNVNTRDHLDEDPNHEIEGLITYSKDKLTTTGGQKDGYCLDCREDVNTLDHWGNPAYRDHDIKGF